jgi:CubicO group peptidase (beta-lactamase class C family)
LTPTPVTGFVAPGFETVADEFERNFVERGELGAAFAATRGSEPIIDIWGGSAAREPATGWNEETLQVVFSGTKGFVAVCVLMLVERGVLELDRPVVEYWPEFAARGKRRVLVRHLVSHTAGLPQVSTPLQTPEIVDSERMAALLAAQEPLGEPGVDLLYHALTYGWLCGELVRRGDGRTIGRFFADEVAAPLGLELWIGLPAEQESRVATLELASEWGAALPPAPSRSNSAELSALRRGNPVVFERDGFPWNAPAFHAAEIPGAGAIGSARSIARLYACLAADGELDGVRLLLEDTLRLGRTELSRGQEPVHDVPLAFGVGFELQTERHRLGPPGDAFGHTGAGGSVHGAWPTERVGFSYAMNLMRDDHPADPRAAALLSALYEAVKKADAQPDVRAKYPSRSAS